MGSAQGWIDPFLHCMHLHCLPKLCAPTLPSHSVCTHAGLPHCMEVQEVLDAWCIKSLIGTLQCNVKDGFVQVHPVKLTLWTVKRVIFFCGHFLPVHPTFFKSEMHNVGVFPIFFKTSNSLISSLLSCSWWNCIKRAVSEDLCSSFSFYSLIFF